MRVSIAMCTYNGARFVQEQLESFLRQTLLPDELVVCDDRSSDQTAKIVETFAQSAPFEVRIIVNEQNLRPARNFEKCISLCRGDLIALSDQDDSWCPEKLFRLSEVLNQDEKLGGVFSDGWLMNSASKRSNDHLWNRVGFRPRDRRLHIEQLMIESLLKGAVVTGATLMIRSTVRDLVLPVADSWMHDGWIAWMLALYSGIAAVNEPLITYRVHDSQAEGIRPGSLKSRIDHARRLGISNCSVTVKQFEQLRQHWIQNPGSDFTSHLDRIDEKIRHLQSRMNLPRSFFRRFSSVLRERNEYRLYDNGILSMLKDVLL